MNTAATKPAKKGGKKNRKFGRNAKRGLSNGTQEYRTAENKARNVAKSASQRVAAAKKAEDTKHGLTRAQRRAKDRWAKEMRAEQERKKGVKIVATPTATSLAMVRAWQQMKDRRAAQQAQATATKHGLYDTPNFRRQG